MTQMRQVVVLCAVLLLLLWLTGCSGTDNAPAEMSGVGEGLSEPFEADGGQPLDILSEGLQQGFSGLDSVETQGTQLGSQYLYEGVFFEGECVHACWLFYRARYGIDIGRVPTAAGYAKVDIAGMSKQMYPTGDPPVHAMVVFARPAPSGHVAVVAQSPGGRVATIVESNVWKHWAGGSRVVDLHNYSILAYFRPTRSNGPNWPPTPWPSWCREVRYDVHAADFGWLGAVANGEIAGTMGDQRRLEAIKITTAGRHISYRAHVSGIGWQGWVRDGRMAGTIGQRRQMEAIQIKVDRGHVTYYVHVANLGWRGPYRDGQTGGTTGQGLRLEAIAILVKD